MEHAHIIRLEIFFAVLASVSSELCEEVMIRLTSVKFEEQNIAGFLGSVSPFMSLVQINFVIIYSGY
ncbi:MAG: hypothetical protein Ct9H300mP28_36670 [Pseudomonadota bacterium]|nr:MAG: hypothetical protein Ct9H300mP28_36670 [Pseudomonadota bacterium]